MKLEAKYLVTADVRLLTGLHIGTSKDEVEIGGLDNPVIKTPSGEPYIPGSSLKGKMRMLMEFYRGLVNSNGEVHSCANGECVVCELFGRAIDKKSDNENVFNRSRLIVRDAFLDKESLRAFKDFLETEWTEIKYENSINRIDSKANPRQQERVPAGACFKAEFVVNVFSDDGDKVPEGTVRGHETARRRLPRWKRFERLWEDKVREHHGEETRGVLLRGKRE